MRRKGRPLHGEERSLWNHVARTVNPRHPNVRPAQDDALPLAHNKAQPHKPVLTSKPALLKSTPARPAPQLHIDGATARRLKRGQAQIDAKLDLHGMRQTEAHDALVSFILGAQARGARCVLVITGKGTKGAGHSNPYETPGPGILKSRLGQWLAQAPLSAITYGLRKAHPRHGGSGAHYVFIRKIKG